MKITLKSPAAGHSAGDTADVEDQYARWLVEQGYAVEAIETDESSAQTTKREPSRARHAKQGSPKNTKRDDDAE